MTVENDIEAILTHRAERLAKRRKQVHSTERKFPVAVFAAGSEFFGIPNESLTCILNTPKIATMPNLPPWLKGMAQFRGELVGIADLARWFGDTKNARGALTVVVEKTQKKLGLLVDSVVGFRDIGNSDIAENFNDSAKLGAHPIRATTKDLVIILDIPKLFDSTDMRVDAVHESLSRAQSPDRGETQSKDKNTKG